MSNVIDFLERLGQDAQLRNATDAELERALIGAQIDPQLREAILRRDQHKLETLLGASANVCCMIIAPAREDDDEDEHEGDDSEKKRDDDESGDDEQALRQTAG